MNKQFRNAFLRLAILSILQDKDIYGYDLVKQIGENFDITAGTLYPILYKLTDENLVETYLQESREGGARKYYKLNQKGKQAVKKESKEWERLIKKYQQFLQNIANSN